MRKKKKDKKKLIILSVLLVLLLVSLVTIVRDDRKLTSIEKNLKDSITNISNVVSIPFFFNDTATTEIYTEKESK